MTIYKQYDSRWAKKNYNGSSSIGTAACGPFSVANVIVEHKAINPMDVVKFMQNNGYAVRNQGTAWDGIPAALKHFGATDVKAVDVSRSMAKVWEYMKKGYDAVFLFRKGSKGGVCWTTQGHYVGMVGYMFKNGKHYLKAKDSGGRDHDGWYAYETTMRGLIPQVWVGKVDGTKPTPKPAPKKKPTGKYTGTIPTPTLKKGSKGAQTKYLQLFLNWYMKQIGNKTVLAVDSIFGVKTSAALKVFQSNEGISADAIYGKITQGKANQYKAKPKPKPKTKAELIVDMAKKCAWPYGTAKSKYAYPKGSPTADFKKAIEKAYPDRSKWGKQTRAGASCDVFVGTVIRASGVDPKFPRGLDGVEKHCKGNPKWQLTGIKSTDKMLPGDVVFQNYKTSGGHIFIVLGNGKIANAHYKGKTYGIIENLSSMRKPSYCKTYNVYRAK